MAARRISLWPLALVIATLTGWAGAGCSSALTAIEQAAIKDPTIFALYNDHTLTQDEFEKRYIRTVGTYELAREDSLSEYEDFLERYVNFRLKVLAAEAAGYTEDPSIMTEINNYRTLFARPYLIDKEVMTPILSDLYEKSREMVEASHILLRVGENAAPADTLAAYQKMEALRDSVAQGEDFGDLAVRNSEDPSARNAQAKPGYRGHLGLFSSGRMVKPFEDQAYSTPVGEVSPIFRTQFGYHLVYVHDRSEKIPDIRVSHIMIRRKGGTAADSVQARERIDSLKTRLDEGEDFTTLAQEFSEERNSAQRGGDLGFLRYDNFNVDATFRETAFAMDELNTVSDVVTSQYGFHLLKITERKVLGTFDEEYETLKATASRLPRLRQAEVELAKDARARYQATIDTTALLTVVTTATDQDVLNYVRTTTFADSVRVISVATLGDSTYSFGQLADLSKNPDYLIRNMETKKKQMAEIADVFLDQAAISHEAALLESRDGDFRFIMEEFRDGLVLFKLMEDSVWTAAAQDTTGLEAYYEAHRDQYQFPDRTRIIEVYSYSDSLLQDAVSRVENGLSWQELQAYITRDTMQVVILDTILVAGPTNSVYDQAVNLEVDAHTEAIPYRTGHIVLFNDGTEAARPKTLGEARAEVVNDYQTVLEDRMVERLRRLYRVRTFPERLQHAFAVPPATTETTTTSTE